MKYLYIVYQYVVALPILLVITAFTILSTIVLAPWKNSAFVHGIQVFWSRSFFWLLLIPVKVTGLENIEKGQSYVFVSNHQSALDVWAIFGYLPVIYKYLMKAELYKLPFVGLACRCAGHIAVDRSNARAALKSIKKIEEQLVDGVSTVIFAEGTRTKTGEIGRFKRGAFQIALHLDLPVIPITINGCYETLNVRAKYVTRHEVHVHVGAPIKLSDYASADEAIEAVRDAVVAGLDKK